MAPPRNRRLGFSRRVQLSLFLSYVIAVVCAVIGLGLILIGRVDPAGYRVMRGIALDMSAPITGAARSAWLTIRDGGQIVSDYIDAGGQNRVLRSELADAQRRLIAARRLEIENARLHRMLKIVETPIRTVAVTRIVGSTFTTPRRLATISAGSSEGVAIGQPVVSVDGLVGRVVETARGASRALLIIDPESTVPVKMAGSGAPALAQGRGDGTVMLRSLIAGGRPFRRGDIAITSGTGGIFAPDVPVAVVISGDSDTALARPLADPGKLDFVIVREPFQEELPPALAPEASAPRP